MKIFENGLLKPEFINPNYRGTSPLGGWPTENGGALAMVNKEYCCVLDSSKQFFTARVTKFVAIKQFTPADIPAGELVWVKLIGKSAESWKPRTYHGYSRGPWKVVPFLIAETAERAEELKDWCE